MIMETMQAEAALIEAGQAEVLNVFGLRVELILTGARTGGAFATQRVFMEPGQGIPPHVHRLDDETFYVLQGEFEFLNGDEKLYPGLGAQIFLPRGTVHAVRNVGQSQGILLGLSTPAGHEEFFRDADTLFREGRTDLPSMMEMCARHGIELLLPPAA